MLERWILFGFAFAAFAHNNLGCDYRKGFDFSGEGLNKLQSQSPRRSFQLNTVTETATSNPSTVTVVLGWQAAFAQSLK